MILDSGNLYSDQQAVTTTASSTNVLKLPKNLGRGEPTPLFVQVTESFAGGTSLAVAVRTSSTLSGSNLNSPTTLLTTAAIPTATLKAGYRFPIGYANKDMLEYSDLNYTVVGTMTAGKITAGISFNNPGTR